MNALRGKSILIVDDDLEQLQYIKDLFIREDARVYVAANGRKGLRQFYKHQPDLVVIDLIMPQVDGWDVCRHIRQVSSVPLLMLTALKRDDEIVRGLNCGADDYVTKPFSPKVLLARARALLRRAAMDATEKASAAYEDEHLRIDLEKRRVFVEGKLVELSSIEYQLLAFLVQNVDHVLTYQQILQRVWGGARQTHTEYVHAYIWRLRQKIEPDPKHPIYLSSERGVGYRFEGQAP